ncbi:hypothetical protein Vadar_006729 [Vaccinium darrowii]|uniref:Uncharacterized protein n=1 Tax=Vaccinium darrowii TaxID=229202 RepID=A0ACB7XXN2_9ERIC|nr:hypothetical protein Vadar_006729 [Vaccinium darrowii]
MNIKNNKEQNKKQTIENSVQQNSSHTCLHVQKTDWPFLSRHLKDQPWSSPRCSLLVVLKSLFVFSVCGGCVLVRKNGGLGAGADRGGVVLAVATGAAVPDTWAHPDRGVRKHEDQRKRQSKT